MSRAPETGWVWREQVEAPDPALVGHLVGSTGFFSQEEQRIAVELVEETLARGADSGYLFLFLGREERWVAYACYGRIPGTKHSFDLYWIATDAEFQGRGLGRRLLEVCEQRIAALGGRRLYVETSSRPQYAPTRGFYGACGYEVAALLEEFYGPGDGKVIFLKLLGSEQPTP